MAATQTITSAARLPGPSELLPGKPDAIVDLQSDAGAELVGGEWRYSDCTVEEIDFVAVGAPDDPLGPGGPPNRTYDVLPHAEGVDFDDSSWRVLTPEETMLRLANGTPTRPSGAPARPAGRDRRPPDGRRRRARRRTVALLGCHRRGSRLRRARLARGPARPRHGPEPHL